MDFDVDVSGEDLLSKNYTICIANRIGIIKGFKLSEEIIKIISSRFGQGFYRYKKSKKGIALLKVRIYCIILYYLIKSLRFKGISLTLCRDFTGKENDIGSNMAYFIKQLLRMEFTLRFSTLEDSSYAHKYAYLMRKDTKNKMNTYIKLGVEDIDKFLRK